jgi:hypothetical protein
MHKGAPEVFFFHQKTGKLPYDQYYVAQQKEEENCDQVSIVICKICI